LKRQLLLASTGLLMLGTAQAANIAPHRAIYDLSLLRASDGSALQSADGRLAFEVQGSTCEGWTVSFRMATKYRPAEGEASLIDTQTTSYEGPGALDFRHQLKEVINGELKQESKIKLTRSSADSEGSGEITTKAGEVFTTAAGAALPMQHQLKLMAIGEAGGGRDSSVVFDGSDGAKSFRAISFVGKAKMAGAIARDVSNPAAAPLLTQAAWPMTVSYFPQEGAEETPEYQVSFDMYANGVATGLVLDYGEFAITGALAKLELLEAAPCP
jgi:EipB-like